jgi:hypothetical protein
MSSPWIKIHVMAALIPFTSNYTDVSTYEGYVPVRRVVVSGTASRHSRHGESSFSTQRVPDPDTASPAFEHPVFGVPQTMMVVCVTDRTTP